MRRERKFTVRFFVYWGPSVWIWTSRIARILPRTSLMQRVASWYSHVAGKSCKKATGREIEHAHQISPYLTSISSIQVGLGQSF